MTNEQSIRQIPSELITEADRTRLLEAALLGLDVYAYTSVVGVWNVWVDGKRIELGRVEHGTSQVEDAGVAS